MSLEIDVTVTVRRLAPGDDRAGFRSGNVDLDRFFIRYAGQNQFRHHIGTTWVAIDEAGLIAGFVTVTASEIAPAVLPTSKRKRLPEYPVPVLRLARLAIDERFRGTGVGSTLVRSALSLAHQMAVDVGCAGVVVDAKPDAVAFYERLGFVHLDTEAGQLGDRPEPAPMFLEMGVVARLLAR